MRFPPFRCALAGFILATSLCGCAGYKLGPTGDQVAGGTSIQVNPVQNVTIEPRLGTAVSHALRKQIQRDGTLRLDTHGQGQIILNTEVTYFVRDEVALDPADTLTPRDYQVLLIARAVATERATGKELLKREFRGRTTLLVGTDLASAERQALPLLAEDLARNIVTALVDREW